MKVQTGEYAKEQLERVVLFSVEVPGFTLIQEMTPYFIALYIFGDSGHWENISFRQFRNSFRNISKGYFVNFNFKYD